MNIEKVVVGLDFSDSAIGAATWVHEAFAPDARLIFVHALESDRDRFLPQATYPTSLEVSLQEAAAERAREIGRFLTGRSTRVEVRSGRAHDVICEIAAREQADLIVVGPHGDHSTTSRFLGTTADRLVRTTNIPVLIGGRRRADEFDKRVVVGVDASPITSNVLAWAEHASDALSARVTAVYALKPPSNSHAFAMARTSDGDDATSVAESRAVQGERDWLLRAGRLAGIDPARLECDALFGDAAESIIETAKQQNASLIIVGRRDSIGRLPALLGRTLRHVLHEAECALLVVTPTDDRMAG
jgi:nucleotide-binding universal stress UspA family protein